MRLQGKIALVTGAASGFGEGIARAYAEQGAKVAVADLNLEGAKRVAGEIGGVALGGDVASSADIKAMVDGTVSALGGLDIVVNNAGWTYRNQPSLDVSEEEFDKVFAINVKSVFLMAKAAYPALKARGGGSFITISSTAGLRPRPGLTWYNGTKGAVNVFTQSLAQEWAKDNVRVNAVCPVMGVTGLTSAFMGVEDTPENRQRFLATIPIGRLSTPADIANACVWLAEDSSSFITGILLPVDGGRTA
ncbi:glucose 1-dehydrogenase [Roseomonas sp. SSH11]|uniref:Glucose 1-dehydrogenase n=1 Tax=Pararoseomonas baculiformis TaxID=2820812 RepID=A0ABS4A9R9_9PROT|nr:glucose 1-dehydrogenase [Pararoseomonas baculiformis]MBP0443751.1 glucose 1-dehydrogenase [Pararoseomonas baculiformis]